MEHLVRAGGLLGAVLVITAIAILLPRLVSPPEFLEDYGLYRSTDDSEEWANWPQQYADSATCKDCHEDRYSIWAESQHSSVVCETCHGPARAHMDEGASLDIDSSREFCGLCHDEVLGRRSDFPQVSLEEHGGQSICVTCHSPHDATFQIMGAPPVPHGLEGRNECATCHELGRMMPFPKNHTGLSSDMCLNCHTPR